MEREKLVRTSNNIVMRIESTGRTCKELKDLNELECLNIKGLHLKRFGVNVEHFKTFRSFSKRREVFQKCSFRQFFFFPDNTH